MNARVPFAVVGALSLCGTLVGCLLPRLESYKGQAQEENTSFIHEQNTNTFSRNKTHDEADEPHHKQ